MSGPGISEKEPFSARSVFLRWELLLVLFIIIAGIVNSNISPYFLQTKILLGMTFNFMEIGIVVLIMSFVIIMGQIDLSVGSNMAMSAAVMGISYQMGVNMWVAVLIGLAAGTLGGFFNGFLHTRVKIHSIIITLGTYSLFRGIAYVILGDKFVTDYTDKFQYLGQGRIGNTLIPVELVIFIVLAIIFGIILHKSKFGRYLYAIGNNELASRYSGIPVDRIKVIVYSASGFMCALAGILFSARITVTRPNIGATALFDVVTIVLLGGVSIYGGQGSIVGVVLSLFLVGMIRYGLSLINVPSNVLSIIIGFILITAILLPKALSRVFRSR